MKRNILKILIAYHKPYKLLKSKIYTPIHVGRELAIEKYKNAKMLQKDYRWLMNSMIGDNTGENISLKNLLYGESSAAYWAWKNYDKIGAPDYIGLMQYRRLFDFRKCTNNIEKFVQNYDMLIMEKYPLNDYEKNNYNQYKISKYHHIEDFDKAIEITKRLYPEYNRAVDKYLKLNYAYFCNIYIMKKELFFKYCEWMFSILRLLEPQLNMTNYTEQEKRLLGYVAERLTGIFYIYMTNEKNIKSTEIPLKYLEEKPHFQKLRNLIRKLKPIYFQ